MTRSNNVTKTSSIKPDTAWSGIFNFLPDIYRNIPVKDSLEALDQKNKIDPFNGCDESNQPETTIIYKKNDIYHVYFHMSELDSNWGVNLTSFTVWMKSLLESDVIHIHQTGDIWDLTSFVQAIGVFSTECKAKKVFVVDHPIENALCMLVCDDVIITEFGAITFTNTMNIDPSRWDLIYEPYLKSLFSIAVERKYLTSEEVDLVFNNNAIIFKTAKQLKDQGVLIS